MYTLLDACIVPVYRDELNHRTPGADIVEDSEEEDIGWRKKILGKAVSNDDSDEEDEVGDVGSDNDEEQEEKLEDEDEEEEDLKKPTKAKTMFDQKGRLRREFLENEAELSGSEDDISEDEDERELDRYGTTFLESQE